MADGGSYASVVAAAQATAVTPAGGNAAADPAAAPPAATPPAAAVPAAAATPPAAAAAAGLTATDLFNDATTREIGGVGPDQVNLIASDLIGVQQMLSAADPQINNLSDLHTHIIINQLNEEIASVENANAPTTGTLTIGTDLGQYVGRSINDIHRDIIDIAQGDAGVQALFNPTPLPALNTPAAPFHDNAAQTTFITQWIQDSNHLGQAATTIENNGFTGDVAGLVQQIQTYATNSSAFDQAQGGLWSARFWNEFRTDGTSGTAANALIEGLQTHNAGEVNAAVEQLAANSADVGSNNIMADGGSYASVVAAAQATAVTPAGGNAAADPAAAPPAATPPAAAVPAAAATPPAAAAAAGLTATDLFNDATTREIGGVGPDQVNLIASDLIGVQQMLSAADPQINNLSDLHTHIIINQLNEEIASVENANAPTTGTLTIGTDLGQYVGRSINDIHRDIIDIAQGDAGVQALFNPTPLPALNTPAAPFHDNAAQTTFITQWIQDSNHLGQAATTIENNGFTGDVAGLVQQIQTYANNSNAFDQAQGGLWSARFWNEFRTDGTSGTAANALIEGLQTHNAGEVNAAVEQLAANSADVGAITSWRMAEAMRRWWRRRRLRLRLLHRILPSHSHTARRPNTSSRCCARFLGPWPDVQRRESRARGRVVAKRGRGRRPGTWQHRTIHDRSHQRANGPSGGDSRGAIHRRHADPCQHDLGRYYDRAIGGHGLGKWRRNVRQRRRCRNGVAHEPSRHPQYRQ